MSRFDELVAEFKNADPELLDLLLEESQRWLAAQLQVLLASDTRANGLLAVSVALGAAGLAIAASSIAAQGPLFWTALTFVGSCAIVAALAVWALWPSLVDVTGWKPATFVNDVQAGHALAAVKHEMVALLQIRIDRNTCTLAEAGWRARLTMMGIAASPLAGIAGGAISAGYSYQGAALLFAIAAVVGAATLVARSRIQDVRRDCGLA